MNPPITVLAQARTDARDWLVSADEPLAGLQLRAGGELPGLIASPALLELVRKARLYGLKLARTINAQADSEQISAWVEATPEGDGCTLAFANWQAMPIAADEGALLGERRAAIVREVSELSARLDADQNVVAVESRGADLARLADAMREDTGRPWSEFVAIEGQARSERLHWRLLDGARVEVPGSDRSWHAHLRPVGNPPGGFELHLIADRPALGPQPAASRPAMPPASAAVGREIAPVLRQPIARIIANAETIRTQLAGPLADEYSAYAADIAAAGQHLLALLDDLIALEAVEDEQFVTAPDPIDLADVARRAAGILGVRARERGITVQAPKPEETAPAIGEFRRVLQILLNLIGNAVRYAPEGSHVRIHADVVSGQARLVVADEGEGFSEAQQARLFEKFERLGRQGDGGTGLGLYISRRLARAMGGDLSVDSAAGTGARFVLMLPADPQA